MKDLDGREYDGWVMQFPERWGGLLEKARFNRTRSGLWDDYIGVSLHWRTERREAEIQRYRRIGIHPVKVRIAEVTE